MEKVYFGVLKSLFRSHCCEYLKNVIVIYPSYININ